MTSQKPAAELRSEFDATFARPPAPPAAAGERFIVVLAGQHQLALRCSEIDSLHRYAGVATLPDGPPGLLGLAGVRGQLVAVYDLSALLAEPAGDSGRIWLALCAADKQVAFAITQVQGLAHVERDQVRPIAAAENRHVREAFEYGGIVRGILDLRSLLDAMDSALAPRGIP
jgi:purine-binding chemotaxis protein CheW